MVHNHVGETRTRIESLRAEAKTRSQALLERAKDRGDELLEEVQGRGRRALKDSKLWIMENPARAVGVAFIAGAMTSALLRRRED